MHAYETPQWVVDRVMRTQGKLHSLQELDPARTALVVIDMQNYYVAEGFPSEAPAARAIVPNINRLADKLRPLGGAVVWIRTTSVGALTSWRAHHEMKLSRERRERRLSGLLPDGEGYRLYGGLEPKEGDIFLDKIKYSALCSESCSLHEVLTHLGVDTLLICGTKTNVCCETTGREASTKGYMAALISDGTATLSDDEHAASLNAFHVYFGDVISTDGAIDAIEAGLSARDQVGGHCRL